LGDDDTGKRSLVIKFCHDEFLENSRTMYLDYKKEVNIDQQKFSLDIEFMEQLQDDSTADGFIFLFALQNKTSFENLEERIKAAQNITPNKRVPPLVVVGARCDLEDERAVSFEEGKKLAENYGGTYVEASAKTGENLDEIFVQVIHNIKAKNTDKFLQVNQNIEATQPNQNKNTNSGTCLLC